MLPDAFLRYLCSLLFKIRFSAHFLRAFAIKTLMTHPLDELLDATDSALLDVATRAAGPAGSLPLTDEMLLNSPSGDLFGMTQSAGMGWDPNQLLRDQVLILSTQGGLRAENGKPIALGLSHGALGSRPAGEGRRRGAQPPRAAALRRRGAAIRATAARRGRPP